MPVVAPIVDFRGGLDTRKMNLTLPAGTLTTCDNAHINQGAEIEKRKAFVQNAIPYTSTFPTYGACGTPAGMVILRVSVSELGAPARNCTGPAIGPLTKFVWSVDCASVHCHHLADQSE